MSMLGEMDIEVVDHSEGDAADFTDADKEDLPDWVAEEEGPAERRPRRRAPDTSIRYAYLQEMGGVPLLSREAEVAIAKQIEAGENEIKESIFSIPLALQYIITLAQKLKDEELTPREVFGDEDEGDKGSEEQQQDERDQIRVEAFVKHLPGLKKLAAERARFEDTGKGRKSGAESLKLEKKRQALSEKIQAALFAMPLNRKHINDIAEKLEEAVALVDRPRDRCATRCGVAARTTPSRCVICAGSSRTSVRPPSAWAAPCTSRPTTSPSSRQPALGTPERGPGRARGRHVDDALREAISRLRRGE
jgi:RNA polymerase primary sigma factor